MLEGRIAVGGRLEKRRVAGFPLTFPLDNVAQKQFIPVIWTKCVNLKQILIFEPNIESDEIKKKIIESEKSSFTDFLLVLTRLNAEMPREVNNLQLDNVAVDSPVAPLLIQLWENTLTTLFLSWGEHSAFTLERQAIFALNLKAVKSCRKLKTVGIRYDASLERFDDIFDVPSDLSDMECLFMEGQLPAETTLPKLVDFLLEKKAQEPQRDSFELRNNYGKEF